MITTASFVSTAISLNVLIRVGKWRKHVPNSCYAIIALYNDEQALQNHYPELHIRIDYEDFMAKQSNFNLIEYRLSDAELDTFEKWVTEQKISPSQALNYCGEKSIKVSLTFSEHNMSWCASLTGRDGNKFNAESTLTTWSDDPIEALYMAVFKASIIFHDGKWVTRQSSNRG